MLCAACGKQDVVVGRFCSNCDRRARAGLLDRRRPVGGAQWQALWGLNYSPARDSTKRRRLWQGSITVAAVAVAVLLSY